MESRLLKLLKTFHPVSYVLIVDTKTKALKISLCVHGRVISVNAITKEIGMQAGIFVKKHCD